jgi:L-lactate dehydrogenase
LQCAGIVSEIQILDANGDLAAGEALDLLHGTSVIADQRIYAGDYARAADSDIFVITAGLRRKPDESRLDLINRNVALFEQILASLKTAGFRKDALIFVVSNPVDILTQLAVVRLGLPWKQVLGLGTMLDTARFRSLLADELKLAPTQVKALILGEHGDTMLPIWSSATAAGLPLDKFPGVTASFQTQLFERTKGSGAEVIRRKGGAGWAVGLTIAEVVHCIALDRRQLLPVSSVQQGKYGLRDIAISVPTIVGRSGVIEQVELSLWPKEQQGLQASARALQEIWSKVKPKN